MLGDFNCIKENTYFRMSFYHLGEFTNLYKEKIAMVSFNLIRNFVPFKQLINSSIRIIENKTSLNVPNSGVIDIGVLDHQFIYCIRNIEYSKAVGHKQLKICSCDTQFMHFINSSL